MPTPSIGLHVFLVINKFLTIDHLFIYLKKKRHNGSVIKNLNKILRLEVRLRIMESKILFLKKCIQNHVCSSHFTFSIKNAKLCPSLKIEIFLENSINCFSRKIPLLECQLKNLWHQNVMTLSLFDRIRFLRLMSSIHKKIICRLTAHRISKVAYLIKKRFGHIKEPSVDGVVFICLRSDRRNLSHLF